MQGTTFKEALDKIGCTLPGHIEADAEVPVLTGPQAQGDLMVIPMDDNPLSKEMEPVTAKGIQVVTGEATGNTHWLHAGSESPGVLWHRVEDGVHIGVVEVPAGQSALLIHSDEHGANGIGAGVYAIHGKREQADEIRRVAD